MAVKDKVEEAISGSAVTVFSKSYCPYCKRAKALLQSEYPSVEVKVLELDEVEDGSAMQDYLHEKTGQRTVPNIFIKQEHVGGCDNLVSLNSSGKLKTLLA